MTRIEALLVAVVVLLFFILLRIGSIAARLKEKFPTPDEEDYKWSQDDPMGHWESHKKDKE